VYKSGVYIVTGLRVIGQVDDWEVGDYIHKCDGRYYKGNELGMNYLQRNSDGSENGIYGNDCE
jgi:hypothetical protein